MPKHVALGDLTREERQELLYDMRMVRGEGMKTHPKVTVVTLKRPLRMVTSAHRRITKDKALGWMAHAIVTGSKYDRCFDVETYTIKLPKDFVVEAPTVRSINLSRRATKV